MRMEMRMELQMLCPLCNASIGSGLSEEEEMELKLFGATKYGKCPHCGHPKELYGLSAEKIKIWKIKVDTYLLAKNKYAKSPEKTSVGI